MTLYELTTQYQALLELAEDPDVDPKVLADTMDGLDGDIEEKADGYAKVIRSLEGRIGVIKAEEDRLRTRRGTMENSIIRMKQHLQASMTAIGKTKFKTDLFSFGIQKNPASVVIDAQSMDNMPEEYISVPSPTWNKTAIKDALKAGKDLTGIAHLEQSESLRIR